MHGTECTLLHEHGDSENWENYGKKIKSSTVLQNFPELLMFSSLGRKKSLLY